MGSAMVQALVLLLAAFSFPVTCAIAAAPHDLADLPWPFGKGGIDAFTNIVTGGSHPAGVTISSLHWSSGMDSQDPRFFAVHAHVGLLALALTWWSVGRGVASIEPTRTPTPAS